MAVFPASSSTAARQIGRFIYDKIEEQIIERTGPFKAQEGEHFYHGTQQPPALDKTGSFITHSNFFVVPKEAKHVAAKFASGDGFSWKRQPVAGEEVVATVGKLLKVAPAMYMKTLFGGIHYIPPGHEVPVVKVKNVEKEPETALDAARKAAQASQFD
jgi:hypothetical protein